jgi:hypothetical protein
MRKAWPPDQGGRDDQPTAVYGVEQDRGVADEYRDGDVGAGRATLPLIPRALPAAHGDPRRLPRRPAEPDHPNPARTLPPD